MNRFPVLMYHRIVSPECPVPGGDPEEKRYAVSLEAFRAQLELLVKRGRRGVSMAQIHQRLSEGEGIPGDWVGITFDDGNESDFAHATPMLCKRGFAATFYVCGNRLGVSGGLEKEMLAEMHGGGMHVGAHGMTHRFFSEMTAEEEAGELNDIKQLLSDACGAAVDHFAPPGGRYISRTVASLRASGYVAMGTSEFGFNPTRGARFEYRRLPVSAGTSASVFEAYVMARPFGLLPQYARALGLSVARGILGDTLYRRLRSAGLGKSS